MGVVLTSKDFKLNFFWLTRKLLVYTQFFINLPALFKPKLFLKGSCLSPQLAFSLSIRTPEACSFFFFAKENESWPVSLKEVSFAWKIALLEAYELVKILPFSPLFWAQTTMVFSWSCQTYPTHFPSSPFLP